ncbi:hypothetical protein [Candidatus Agathobaculum pullicola]|uniref:hypothetical protein n=1 Tax=Candidatus Agathobaculum pullicola TaxID=2838426 RepID=UPI003F9208F3
MQWDKVKNVLIVILLVVNLFLVGNFGAKIWQNYQRSEELETDLRTLTQEYGRQLDDSFRLPKDKVLPILSIDRSRADEEAVAQAMLGEELERTEQEDGTVLFQNESGKVEWHADGTVRAECLTGADVPDEASAALRLTRRLLSDWGLQAEDESFCADGRMVTLTGTVAGQPVHNRQLTLRFDENGGVAVTGLWSFGTPYTTVRGSGVSCNAADALLEFAARAQEVGRIDAMTAGYRMEMDSNRRLQLTPTWKITTDSGEYLVDCAKKTIVDQEN